MDPEVYSLIIRIALLLIVIFGCLSFLFLASFLSIFLLQAIRHPGEIERHPWSVLAHTNNLFFRSFGYLDSGSQIIGNYRDCNLKLTIIRSSKYSNDTILEVKRSSPANELEVTNEFDSNASLNTEELIEYLAPHGLPVPWKGTIKSSFHGQKIYYQQPGQEEDQFYLQSLFDFACDLITAYPKVVTMGGQAVPSLLALASNDNPLRFVAFELLKSIGRDTQERLSEQMSQLLCPHCLVHCACHKEQLMLWEKVIFYGCRSCRQSQEFLEVNGQVIAVLDSQSSKIPLKSDEILEVNWFTFRQLFDFDEVHIICATDEEVERFAVKVGNDTETFRKSRYKQMNCWIEPGCQLSENTVKILKQMFGCVEIKRVAAQSVHSSSEVT